MDEEENVIKTVVSKDLVGDFRHLRKNTRSLISCIDHHEWKQLQWNKPGLAIQCEDIKYVFGCTPLVFFNSMMFLTR